MLLIVEKGIRGSKYHAINRYAKKNNKSMEDYDPCTESSYPMFLDVNNLYGWVKPQKLPIDGFKIKKINYTSTKTSNKTMMTVMQIHP